ncbi:hypothetical protein NSB25_26145 [Acetatifactor muris]|jgi:hypothetical protein|uniref:DNA mismatch repair protein MutS n=1 Tax=Acetatifactor muris TaxID=879566 RepID=A0A2K4ZP19_9FIRM|nr:hypothetical protein [Acetatifactor muris]MCI8799566.1 hypothetical protein [Lachnospiraceae bacterium]MCR2050718.1 hypothetical protein [Acetatifactor muris]SOY32234.1 DNA mismatch repair protein MutS [Acetatifactor muris]
MEYLIFILTMVVFAVVIFGTEAVRVRKEEKKFIRSLYEEYDKLVEKDYALERFVRIDSYFNRHRQEGQLDDITWNDLDMDELFKRMNYTLSASGEEYLYYTLRTLKQSDEELEHLEETVRFFGEHPDIRVKVQLAARRLGYTGKYSLYDYLDNLDLLGERSSRKNIFLDCLFPVLIGLMWVNFSAGVIGIVILTVYNIISYFREKAEIDPYITSFSYVMRLLQSCGELEKISMPVYSREQGQIREARKQLQGMKRNSYWVMSPYRGNASGDILAIFLDYIRMIFHIDLIKFNSMLKVLQGHIGDVDILIACMGRLETAIAIWEFRESLKNGWCIPDFDETGTVEMEEGYHPLLEAPVKNGICAGKGVLLTGSNASGKSTFLKTMAINAIFAQTIHTCTADRYRTSKFRVYSSMALRDDIGSGESYYIVEIKALKRILDAAFAEEGKVLCFVDEVLRGTNTVERIAASTQILKSLCHPGVLCFAATHDIELTELLQKDFDNYHFEEDIRDGDIFFNYRIKEGRATTRNAIRLLELMGYDQEVIRKATAQAEHFVTAGVWQ